MASGDDRGKRPAEEEAEGSRAPCRQCHGPRVMTGQRHLLPPVSVTQPGTSDQPVLISSSSNSSGSSGSSASDDSYDPNPWGSPVSEEGGPRYSHSEALTFCQERDDIREEFAEVSKKFGIDQAEWEHQRKQFCDAISALSAENDRLKAAVNRLADKVNAQGETSEARLDAVDGRIDEVTVHGMHLGASMGLAAMSSQTGEDYSVQPVGFRGGPPEDIENIDEHLEQYDDHAAAVATSAQAQSVLNRLFKE